MKITLILSAAPNDALAGSEPFMPLSLPLLAASAPDHEYRFIDMMKPPAPVDFDEPVDLVGISVRMTGERTTYELADEFRRRGVKVILGGPQVSAVPFRAIEHADAVVIGEGETLWPRVLEDVAAGNLKNFYVSAPGPFDPRGRTCFQLDSLPDLAHIPMPLRHLHTNKYQFDTVFASRGCPIDCDFCAVPGLFGKKERFRPVEDVVREIDTFKGFYYLLDDTVFGREHTYDYYLELYDALAGLETRRFWHGQANLGAVRSEKGREVIRRAVKAGLLYVAVGMESINPVVLEKSGAIAKTGLKGADDALEQMREGIAFLQDLGVVVSGWFAVGYEDDSVDTYYRTLEFCLENHVMPIMSPVFALDGTRLRERLEEEGKLGFSGGSLTNFPHPDMKPESILEALDHSVRTAFTFGEIVRRTRFYMKRFTPENHNSGRDRVQKSMFLFILQFQLKKIFLRENANLAAAEKPGQWAEGTVDSQ